MDTEAENLPALERVGKREPSDHTVEEEEHDNRTVSMANTTDSMITVPLSEGQESKHASREPGALAGADEHVATRHSSVESEYSAGSIDSDSDFEEAVIEEASVVQHTRKGSVFTLKDNEGKVESARGVASTDAVLEGAAVPEDKPTVDDREDDEDMPVVTNATESFQDSFVLPDLPTEPSEPAGHDSAGENHDTPTISAIATDSPPLDFQLDTGPSLASELIATHRLSVPKPEIMVDTQMVKSRPSSITAHDVVNDISVPKKTMRGSMDLQSRGFERGIPLDMEETLDVIEEREETDTSSGHRPTPSTDAILSPVDWDRLDRTEQQEQQDVDDDSDEQTALLLARLEQENQALAIDPKAAQSKQRARKITAGRPPSVYDIKSLVHKSHRQSMRFDRAPSPPPMTELDFWAALVQDYPATAQRLPTLTSNKIRGGIPPPLRGVVWVSMAGARDRVLEEQYDRLCGEQSPYENIISKDIGRSFPGVEMFRDPEGEGQRMLGRVLKCFSLHDSKIGYCQGLGFLVGPLLMQMGEREAFCVLVRLMEDYDLRSCFEPDLSGLHLRIYQFQELLHQHLPHLAAHLDKMQVEAAYLSQWFLSFFAVTCPLPMLFRIFDVIFAEGASETTMRVALSVMRRNERRILALNEFEDIIQLLLGRALWDTYGLHKGSGDELVNDFVSFTGLVTRENLRELDASFRAAQSAESGLRVWFFPEVQNAATRFLGRLWTPATPTQTPKSATLSPNAGSATSPRAGSFLHRSVSGQSLASTHKSVEGSLDSATSSSATTMTDATSVSRVTSNDYAASVQSGKTQMGSIDGAMRAAGTGSENQQIEDLLIALSEMQKEHAQLAAELAKEREEREEDCAIVRNLLDGLQKQKRNSRRVSDNMQNRRRTAPANRHSTPPVDDETRRPVPKDRDSQQPYPPRLAQLVASAEYRFPLTPGHQRRSTTTETKSQLRHALAQARDHVASESSRAADLSRQLDEKEQETVTMREQLREARSRAQSEFVERQKAEKNLIDLRQSQRQGSNSGLQSQRQTLFFGNSDASATSGGETAGLREFKLGRAHTAATPAQFSKRSSSLMTRSVLGSISGNPQLAASGDSNRSSTLVEPSQLQEHSDREALLMDLVNAKTAEAVARQELEEMRGKFESMRKLLGQPSPSSSNATPVTTPGATSGHKANPSEGFLSFMGSAGSAARDALASAVSRESTAPVKDKEPSVSVTPAAPEAAPAVAEQVKEKPKVATAAAAWGWGGWGKRNVTS